MLIVVVVSVLTIILYMFPTMNYLESSVHNQRVMTDSFCATYKQHF